MKALRAELKKPTSETLQGIGDDRSHWSGTWGTMWSFMRDTAAADVKAAVDLQWNLKRQIAALTMEEDLSSGFPFPHRAAS
jgi:hypothetical protein